MLFNIDNIQDVKKKLFDNIDFDYKYIQHSTLGGKENIAILINVSKDKRENWYNDIYQNSNFANFYLDNKGNLELFSKHYQMPKFRKAKNKSINDVILKLEKYFTKVAICS